MPRLQGAQAQASDPSAHAALSASAGTGKTHVLASRVIRLLLRGVPPSSILCLTFTKAGAAEMANRVGERLAHWVRLPDADLAAELAALHEEFGERHVRQARRLFAQVLESPGGGLRIQTIHSFAQALLAAFPAEADIAPGFRPIEGRAEEELARRTLAALLEQAERDGDENLGADISALTLRLGEEGAERYLMACARAPEAMAALGEAADIETRLNLIIGIEDGNANAEIVRRLTDGAIDHGLFARLGDANRRWGRDSGLKIAAHLDAFLDASPDARADMLDSVGSGLVTAAGEPCKARAGQIKADPGYQQWVDQFTDWLVGLRTLVAAANFASIQAAGLRAGQAFAAAYTRAKRAAGVADFNDLIRWTRHLFAQAGMGEWVRYKLDQRTDHVLVDEAQDTNADQWAIVDALAGEFFSGSSEGEGRQRSLFMVGDYKQAIFGFQGTNPREYENFRGRIADKAEAAMRAAIESQVEAREFRNLSIEASFRSSPPVLDVVDAVIAEVGFAEMGLPEPPNLHAAHHRSRPGCVELWAPFGAEGDQSDLDSGEEAWINEPARLYADALARQVGKWLAEAPPVASTGRPLCAGDILILVRSRGELASLIVARLYAHGVPVAGIDRLHLHKPLAVRDLLSTIKFAVQPLDDLNLAGLLVSPLIGWDQDQLYELAQGRSGKLWPELATKRERYPHWQQAHAILSEWLAMAEYVPPALFLETILSGPLQGRSKLIRRLGEAARDPIEELVSSAMMFEREEIASLDAFLAWFGQGEVEVKRDPAAPVNAVRVMTVHGAKGLEAPLVVLADATHDPDKVGGVSSMMTMEVPGAGPVPLLRPRKAERSPLFHDLVEAAKRSDAEEHWRLAYVGLTRSAERLVVAGVKPSRGVPPRSWHAATARAMAGLGAASFHLEGWGDGLRWEGAAAPAVSTRRRREPIPPIAVPDLLRCDAPDEERPSRPLAPSQLAEDKEAMPPPSPAMRFAAERGNLLHALFERLPATLGADRRELALRWLGQRGVEGETALEIVEAACSLIDDPRFASLFGPGSLGEAPIAATLADGRVVAGTVDRLCIGEEVVRVIDFKTGRAVPRDEADIPQGHRLQMDAYAQALAVIFPGRRIEASLLYTSGPRLFKLTG
ncbi:double-strand break repair helicase AddA [Sphingomonas xanthus]|uniref:DNA 3'-5' helicase n=2 Tax=Sphingomonas xanthus TaxID=2594473 RepID=A0A516IUB5_9SPHN|nr:double-strand break repair helicase AddA [Sphingomonas xanthus]